MDAQYKEKLITFFRNHDHFSTHNDIEFVSVEEGRAKVQLKIAQHHLNGLNVAHGGIIFTIADMAMALAVHSHGREALTLSADISFFQPAQIGDVLTAEAEELVLRKSIASYLVSVKNEGGDLLATMKCQAFRKGDLVL